MYTCIFVIIIKIINAVFGHRSYSRLFCTIFSASYSECEYIVFIHSRSNVELQSDRPPHRNCDKTNGLLLRKGSNTTSICRCYENMCNRFNFFVVRRTVLIDNILMNCTSGQLISLCFHFDDLLNSDNLYPNKILYYLASEWSCIEFWIIQLVYN